MNQAEIVSMIRSNRKNDLKEWVDYHFAIGFDKITILDNESTFSVKELFSNYKNVDVREIKINDLPDKAILSVYYEISKEKEKDENYVAFIDDDEYIFIKNNKKIKEILNNDMEILCLYLNLISSHEILEDRDGTIIETFNYTISFNPNRRDRAQIKSIVNFKKCKNLQWGLDGPHMPVVDNIKKTIRGEIIKTNLGNTLITKNFYDNQEIYIYHYVFQTYADWIFKRERRPHSLNFHERPGDYSVLDNNMINRKKELGI